MGEFRETVGNFFGREVSGANEVGFEEEAFERGAQTVTTNRAKYILDSLR